MTFSLSTHQDHDFQKYLNTKFVVFDYEPVYLLATAKAAKYEALVRWHHQEKGLINPQSFLPFLKETTHHKLDAWALTKSSEQIGGLPTHISVHINMSPSSLFSDTFMAPALATPKAIAKRIVLEITEHNPLPPDSKKPLGQLRAHGFRTAIDDFGAGNTKLLCLKEGVFDEIKLDGDFIQDIDNSKSRSIIKSVIDLAHDLDMTVTAERIENSHQAAILRDLGCDFGQGYYFGRPAPFAA